MDYKSLQFQIKAAASDEMKFSGFASTPDLDQGGDIIVKGAYGRTLAERGNRVKVLWQHKSDMPIGKPTLLEEREGGLYMEAELVDTAAGIDAMKLLRKGVIDSMSIGYVTREADYNDDGVRIIKDLDLFEVSLVSFPMNEKAVITAVKNQFNVRELERVLCEAGYSNSQAKCMAQAGIKSLREVGDEVKQQAELAQLADALEAFKQTLRG